MDDNSFYSKCLFLKKRSIISKYLQFPPCKHSTKILNMVRECGLFILDDYG